MASPESAALAALSERVDALEARYTDDALVVRIADDVLAAWNARLDDLQRQVTALASSGASDRALESVRLYAEGLAARLQQLERRIP
jgi:hypothetical protein